MQELHLRQARFTYIACGQLNKHWESIQNPRETGNFKHLYRNELGKNCFVHDAAYSTSKDLAKKTVSDMIMKDRAYEIGKKKLNIMDIKQNLQVWSISFLTRN